MVLKSLTTYHLTWLLDVPKIHTDLLWDFTFLFAGFGLLYFFGIFFYKRKIRKTAELIAIRKKDVAPMISTFLFYDSKDSKEEKRNYVELKIAIRELLKDARNKQVIAEVLLDLQKDVSGDARKKVYALYQELELHIEAIKMLKSWRWEIVSKGILELTQMRVTSSYGFIKKFINDKRGIIRKQAQIAAVSLTHEGITFFLDSARYKISEWQQLKILEVLQNLEGFKPPSFKAWLTSANRDVVLFALRLIKHYSQMDAGMAIIPLVRHKNDHIKSEALFCLKEFRIVEAKKVVKSIFPKCKVEIKIMILDLIAHLGDQDDLNFLNTQKRKQNSFIVKNKIDSAINTIQPGTIEPTAEMDKTLDEETYSENEPKDILENPEVMKETSPSNQNNNSNPDPEFENTQEENVINSEEVEDEEIFNLCFKEELEDILNDYRSESESYEILPLDFLPVVTEENELIVEERDLAAEVENETRLHSENEMEDTLEEVHFQLQLEDLLEGIKGEINEEDLVTTEDRVDASFLPLITEEESEEVSEDNICLEDLFEYEVSYETIALEEDYFEIYKDLLKVEWVRKDEDILPFSDAPIDWNDLTQSDQSIISNKPPISSSNMMITEEKPKTVVPESTEETSLNCFSIFAEMFRDSDKESKLILLDEILAVGEKKELEFLKIVKRDKEKSVRIKANKIFLELERKLNKEESKNAVSADQVIITPSQTTIDNTAVLNNSTIDQSVNEQEQSLQDFLEIEFDLSMVDKELPHSENTTTADKNSPDKTPNEIKSKTDNTLLGSIKSITRKLFDKTS